MSVIGQNHPGLFEHNLDAVDGLGHRLANRLNRRRPHFAGRWSPPNSAVINPMISVEPLQTARPPCKVHVLMASVVQCARPMTNVRRTESALRTRKSGTIQEVRPASVRLALY